MSKPLQMKVASVLGYVAVLMVTLILYSEEAIPVGWVVLRGQ
ncbi:hypothetical protein ACFFTM_03600 [Pseudoduganella plicata]|uniref:Uncharacterized protein n=1 Tax=Pseudoduganella plicata TaxID=321984 RepID=A0AA87YCK3_9BURK|nr:hypothetical protein [Pseudoduganella plicata]GGZ07999.1 hypothetical protein GCM10007388_46890 [Pseudoduganella plicata]